LAAADFAPLAEAAEAMALSQLKQIRRPSLHEVRYYSGVVFPRIHSVDTGWELVRYLTRCERQKNGILPGVWNSPRLYLPQQLERLFIKPINVIAADDQYPAQHLLL
jgi:hypothetical protein